MVETLLKNFENLVREHAKRAIRTSLLCLVPAALAVPCLAGSDPPLAHALLALSERIDETPRDPGLLTDYGNLLARAGRFDDALGAYKASLEADPDSLITLYNLGLLEYELGHRRAAGRRFRQALKIDDDFARGHYGLGNVLAHRELNRRAVKHFARAFSLEPELLDPNHNPEILFNRFATWASMHSYLSGSPQRATRLYNDPQPIVGLLTPELSPAPPSEADAEASMEGDEDEDPPSDEPPINGDTG